MCDLLQRNNALTKLTHLRTLCTSANNPYLSAYADAMHELRLLGYRSGDQHEKLLEYKSYFDGVIVDDLSVSEWVKTISDLFLNKNKIIKIKNFLKKQQIFSWYKVFNLNILPYWKRLKK